MRRFVTQNKILAVFVSLLLLQILFAASESSDLDDVAAMVTNAKKVPHTVFILDTSESMNSFAYSDYIETCDDAIHNAEHAYDICQVSLEQCNNIKSETGCAGGSIDCTSIQNNCTQLDSAKTKIANYCAQVDAVFGFPGYPNEDRTITDYGNRQLRYVGPWTPDEFYTDDLCFYDWTSDTNGDVLSGVNSDNWSNETQDINKATTIGDDTYYGSDRRDWDCITDGNGNMTNGKKFSGVSGFWLNWKYATSLDAVKILLADIHQFSYPPRSRGENECNLYYYKPVSEENDTTACEPGYETSDGCLDDPATGLPNYKKKKTCFVSADTKDPETGTVTIFDTAYLDKSDADREKILKALQKIVAENWKSTEPEKQDDWKCNVYDTLLDFSIYDNKNTEGFNYDRTSGEHPASVNAGGTGGVGCEKCLAFNGNTENPAFIETNCKELITHDDDINREGSFGSYSVEYKRKCCKTSKCTNPKCRDNDLCCKNNAAAYPAPNPGEDPSEGYQQCVVAEQTCELGFYSEFDQDMTHCCDTIECVSGEEADFESYEDCYICKDSTTIKEETKTDNLVAKVVLPTPPAPAGSDPYSYSTGIQLAVKITSMSGLDDIEDLTIKLYSECNGVTPDAWGDLGSFSCYRESTDVTQQCSHYLPSDPTTQGVIMTPTLSGCETSGYKVKAVVSATGRYCDKNAKSFSISLGYQLPDGDFFVSEQWRKVLNPEEDYYMILRNSAGGANTDVVYEYECKNAFYHTQAYTDSSSCPREPYDIVEKFHELGYTDVDYCDPDSRVQETYTKVDGCNIETSYFCSYLCRDEVSYDEPWKCMAWFYQMDEMGRGGTEKCTEACRKESGRDPETGNNNTEECCRCVDENYYNTDWTEEYHFFEPVEGVTMWNEAHTAKKTYHCAVSGIMGSDTQAGWHAEIINGHIHEVGDGSYLLSPYLVKNGEDEEVLFSPYETSNNWISDKTYVRKKKADPDLKSTSISVFQTAPEAQSRENVCIYDLVDNWGGDMCAVCSTCSFGCVDDPSISVADDKCAYPSFWIKVPKSDGGKLLVPKERLEDDDSITNFQNTIKKLKAVGGPTLGETLYDTWRFLGGMYAIYDPDHRRYNYNYNGEKWDKDHPTSNTPYESPYEGLDASCLLSEVVIFSGGQAQFDANEKIETIPGASKSCGGASDAPCEKPVGDGPTEHKPYYETDWSQTSIEKVANFVKTHPFYHPDSSKKAECVKTTDLSKNLYGYDDSCKNDKYYQINKDDSADKAVVNRIHAGAIGEWTLSALYNSTEYSYLENITKKITGDPASEDGKYCALTLGSNTTNCSSTDITDVFISMLKDPMKTDVVSGRPHWTSSLVQPYDVEEKYRGPEAYVAGTVPIEPSISKFWFGNLKKYMIDQGDNSCGITVSCEDYPVCGDGCGGWHKQTFSSPADCFAKTDFGDDMADNLTEFKRLLAGGAAHMLAENLTKQSCGTLPCFNNVTTRTIYYDNNYSMNPLHGIGGGAFQELVDGFGGSVNSAKAEQILDYIYGYDAFAENVADRMKLRFGYGEEGSPNGKLIEVLNPMDIDFNHDAEKKIKIRPLLLGAIVHSKPIAVYYATGTTTTTRVFAGANDGMLHAFDGGGNETWAYIPSKALPAIAAMATATTDEQIIFHPSVDGPITLLHIDKSHDGIINEGEKALLIFGYRRGATGYTVIDVSKPDNPKFVQNIPTGGYSFGKAVVFRKCNQATCSYADQLDYYLAVPGGYDTCADGYTPTCAKPGSSGGVGEPVYGNNFAIYKLESEQFSANPVFDYRRDPSGESDVHKKWLVAPFAAEPFAINTTGKGAVDTEFVYFTDLTGTVFRVNVSDKSPSKWSAKVVFAKRDQSDEGIWSTGKTFTGNNFFPPLEKYNPGNDPDRIPIPVVSGNASLPKINEVASMTVFYDNKPKSTDDDSVGYGGYTPTDYETANLANSNQFHEGKSGWRIDFGEKGDTQGEKGITEPMLVYDFYGSKPDAASGKNGYSLAWNTYIPKDITMCKNFGTSYNYDRLVIDGSQALSLTSMTSSTALGEWNPANCNTGSSSQGASLATSVGVIATKDGFDLTFGAGAEIYRKKEISVLISTTRIIKWYELY